MGVAFLFVQRDKDNGTGALDVLVQPEMIKK